MSCVELLGFGTIALDRIRRVPRIVGGDAKGLAGSFVEVAGGATVNHLAWASALGVRVAFLGSIGSDDEGRFLSGALDRHGIDRSEVVLGRGPTAASDIFVDPTGERAIYMQPGLTSGLTPGMVHRHWAGSLRTARFVSADIAQVPLEALEAALRVARGAGARIAVDLDIPPSEARRLGSPAALRRVLAMAQVLKPTLAAASELTGAGEALEAARILAQRSRALVAVTDGARGAAVARGDRSWRIPVFPARARDATGAGDAFFGGFLAGLLRGRSPVDAARLGASCGALCVEAVGAFPPPDAFRRVMARYRGRRTGLGPRRTRSAPGISPSEKALAAAASALRRTAREVDWGAIRAASDLLAARIGAGGRLHLAGVGKAFFVAARAAATLSSWGFPAQILDCGAAPHGDLGQLGRKDALIAVSKSGVTRELLALARAAHARRIPLVAVTGAPRSPLARGSQAVLAHPAFPEGGPWDLAPMASLAAEAALLDALASELVDRMGRRPDDFAANHPGGSLGRRASRLARRS